MTDFFVVCQLLEKSQTQKLTKLTKKKITVRVAYRQEVVALTFHKNKFRKIYVELKIVNLCRAKNCSSLKFNVQIWKVLSKAISL